MPTFTDTPESTGSVSPLMLENQRLIRKNNALIISLAITYLAIIGGVLAWVLKTAI